MALLFLGLVLFGIIEAYLREANEEAPPSPILVFLLKIIAASFFVVLLYWFLRFHGKNAI